MGKGWYDYGISDSKSKTPDSKKTDKTDSDQKTKTQNSFFEKLPQKMSRPKGRKTGGWAPW